MTEKYYKNYEIVSIGSSDISTLALVGCGYPLQMQELHFGIDSSYKAYVVDEECEIPSHYHLVGAFRKWLRVYDDDTLRRTFEADEIKVYRAGDCGCIVQMSKGGVHFEKNYE